MIKRVISFFHVGRPIRGQFSLWAGVAAWLLVMGLIYRYGASWHIGDWITFNTRWARLLLSLCWSGVLLLGVWWWYRRQLAGAAPPAHAEAPEQVTTQGHYLDQWLQRFRDVLGAGAVYAMPWYLMVGFPGSGKSSLVHRANTVNRLHARLQVTLRDGSAGQFIDGFVSDQAVFMDPDGNLLAQPEAGGILEFNGQEVCWQHLLHWLGSRRQRQPLNGLVWTIDLAWLAQASRAERKVYAQVMHSRFRDIHQALDTRMPLFIVFTKLDLLHGFDEIFQQLDAAARQAVLGVTFRMPDHRQADWGEELTTFWQQWMEQLHALIPARMQERPDPARNSAIFAFTRQLAGMQQHVLNLLRESLDDQLTRVLVPQGVYISSVYQHGNRFDAFASAASRRYQLPDPVPASVQGESVAFFVHRLFQQVIIPAAHLAGENRAYLAQRRRRVAWGMSGLALLSCALLGGWHYYYRLNATATGQVLSRLQHVSAIPLPDSNSGDGLGNEWLPRLDLLREAALSFGNYREKTPPLTDMGLYQGMKLGPWGEGAYLQALQLQFLPALMRGLQADLSAAPAGSEQKLAVLRVMRMLDDAGGRSVPLVKEYMAKRWQQQYPEQGQLQNKLMQHLDHALAYTDWFKARQQNDPAAIAAFTPFRQSIYAAQQELGQLPLYQRLYQGLVSKAADQLPPALAIRDEVGPLFDAVFALQDEKDGQVPRLLTREGMNGFFMHQDRQLLALAAQDAWVLGQRERVYLSDADQQALLRQIGDRYVSEYVNRWQSVMSGLDMSPSDSLDDAVAVLSAITGQAQPLTRVLSTLDNNTRLPLPVSGQVATVGDSIPQRIGRPFLAPTAVLAGQGEQSPRIDELRDKLVDLRRYLEQIASAAEPGQEALTTLQRNLGNRYADPAFALRQYAAGLPAPLDRWGQQLAGQSAQLVNELALSALNQSWQDEVVTPFNTKLAAYYPFDRSASKDVALSDMERFFAPGGTLDSFYQHRLKPVVDGGLLRDMQVSASQRELLDQLARATRIRQAFFNTQGNLEVQFAVEPVDLTANKRRSVLNLDGQLLEYAHGRRDKIPLVWPNNMRDGAESKITLVPVDREHSPRSQGHVGPWAMFRLMQQGELTRVSDASFDVRFPVDQGAMTYRVYTDASQNPFAGGLFSQFRLPATLF